MYIKSNRDFDNHKWIVTYGDITRTINSFNTEERIDEVEREMIAEHRDNQLKKILNNEDN